MHSIRFLLTTLLLSTSELSYGAGSRQVTPQNSPAKPTPQRSPGAVLERAAQEHAGACTPGVPHSPARLARAEELLQQAGTLAQQRTPKKRAAHAAAVVGRALIQQFTPPRPCRSLVGQLAHVSLDQETEGVVASGLADSPPSCRLLADAVRIASPLAAEEHGLPVTPLINGKHAFEGDVRGGGHVWPINPEEARIRIIEPSARKGIRLMTDLRTGVNIAGVATDPVLPDCIKTNTMFPRGIESFFLADLLRRAATSMDSCLAWYRTQDGVERRFVELRIPGCQYPEPIIAQITVRDDVVLPTAFPVLTVRWDEALADTPVVLFDTGSIVIPTAQLREMVRRRIADICKVVAINKRKGELAEPSYYTTTRNTIIVDMVRQLKNLKGLGFENIQARSLYVEIPVSQVADIISMSSDELAHAFPRRQ